jgi:hypothetical protein
VRWFAEPASIASIERGERERETEKSSFSFDERNLEVVLALFGSIMNSTVFIEAAQQQKIGVLGLGFWVWD